MTMRAADRSVAALLPVGPGAQPRPLLRALRSVQEQTQPLESIVVVLNAAPTACAELIEREARSDGRIETLRLDEPSLARALNAGLARTSAAFLARIDADDWRAPNSVKAQLEAIEASPRLAGVGCAFAVVDDAENVLRVQRPPASPAQLRWRLLLGNELAHGSMLLRREALLDVGGWDESLERGQDYALWLRLLAQGWELAAVGGEPLYCRTAPRHVPLEGADETQARAAAQAQLRAWRALPAHLGGDDPAATAMALLTQGLRDQALARIEQALDEGRVSLAALLAWRSIASACSEAQLRDELRGVQLTAFALLIERAQSEGAGELWLWGAGETACALLRRWRAAWPSVAGIVDDFAAGQRRGSMTVGRLDDVPAGAHVLLATAAHARRMLAGESAAALRARGVRIWSIASADQAETFSVATKEMEQPWWATASV